MVGKYGQNWRRPDRNVTPKSAGNDSETDEHARYDTET